MKLTSLVLLAAASLHAQTLGQFRLVDFSARTPGTVSAVTLGANPAITTTAAHGLTTGAAVWIYEPWTVTRRETDALGNAISGNRGRGYFLVTVTDSTHITLASEMYTGSTNLTSYTVSTGDKIIPLTTYTLRDGPRLWLDGPINKGEWSSSTTYRSHEMVSSGAASFMSIADNNTNHAPPDSSWWVSVDPSKVGPGTFTASLRNPLGKANTTPAYTPLKAMLANLTTYEPAGSSYYDYTMQDFGLTGWIGQSNTLKWFMTGDTTAYSRAQQMATRAEDLAGGTPACDTNPPGGTSLGYCGSRNTNDMDYERLFGAVSMPAIGMLYDTLTPAQKVGLANRLLNDKDVLHNGIEASGTAACAEEPYRTGPGVISVVGNTSTGVQIVTGSGFLSMPDMQPGTVIFQASPLRGVGRVKSVDSDTQLTLEPIVRTQAVTIANFAWYYSRPWGYAGARSCGWVHWIKHVTSTPHMIPGLEDNWATTSNYGTLEDDWDTCNRTISGLAPFISISLMLGKDDVRAVRLGEQAINYYMTQTMAQYYKSRMTGKDGHGTEYGTGRTENFITEIALMLKNSFTVTPVGVTTGHYLENLLASYQYVAWLSKPGWVLPWAVGYPATTKFDGTDPAGSALYNMGKPMLYASTLLPGSTWAAATYDYFRNRRSVSNPFWVPSFGDAHDNWTGVIFLAVATAFYDPLAASTSVAAQPTALIQNKSDIDECIAAGLYCVADANSSHVWSSTGWTTTDMQVTVDGAASLPIMNEDSYGAAGNINIIQNNGLSKGAYMLGGNGSGASGYGAGVTPFSGVEHGNTISIYDAANSVDMFPNKSQMQYAVTDHAAAGTGYTYARVNLTPKMRQASANYSPTATVQKSGYTSGAGAARVHRNVIHTGKHVIVYDDVSVSVAHQLRAYSHYQLADFVNPPVRHGEWMTSFDKVNRTAVLTVPTVGRLTSKVLPLNGSNSIAFTSEDYVPPAGTFQRASRSVTGATWSSGTATVSKSGFVVPPGKTITVSGVTPSGFNGTFTVTASDATSVSYALASNPGTYVSGGTVDEPAWCDFANSYNATATACAGNYNFRDPQATGVGAAILPGTFRAHVCSSTDGTTCSNATSAEWVQVYRSSTSETDAMPTVTQPACTSGDGVCAVVEIQDTEPSVSVFSRGGVDISGASFTTAHAGTAQYVMAGVASGHYSVVRGGALIASADVADGENGFGFSSVSGAFTVVGGPVITVTPPNLAFTCTTTGPNPANKLVAVGATGTTLDNWSASKTQSWLTISPTSAGAGGNLTASVSCTGLAVGTYTDTITVPTTTSGITNSPVTVGISLTVYPVPVIGTLITPWGSRGNAYAKGLTVTGGQGPYTWSVTSGALCPGLSLSSVGVLSGTPSAKADCAFSLSVVDSGGVTAQWQFGIHISERASSTWSNVQMGGGVVHK